MAYRDPACGHCHGSGTEPRALATTESAPISVWRRVRMRLRRWRAAVFPSRALARDDMVTRFLERFTTTASHSPTCGGDCYPGNPACVSEFDLLRQPLAAFARVAYDWGLTAEGAIKRLRQVMAGTGFALDVIVPPSGPTVPISTSTGDRDRLFRSTGIPAEYLRPYGRRDVDAMLSLAQRAREADAMGLGAESMPDRGGAAGSGDGCDGAVCRGTAAREDEG